MCVQLFTLCNPMDQAPLTMGFSRQEYWSGLPFPSPRESFRPRDRTQVSHIVDRRFIIWATRECRIMCVSHSSCPTLCNPIDYSLLGSSVHGILQSRILEWVSIPFSRESSWPRNWTQIFCIAGRFFTIWATREAIYWTVIMCQDLSWKPGI